MPFEYADILLSNGVYSENISDNLYYYENEPLKIKVFYNDNTTVDVDIIGRVDIRDPQDLTWVYCYDIDLSACHHSKDRYSEYEIEDGRCKHCFAININRLVNIDGQWKSIENWLMDKFFIEHPDYNWFQLKNARKRDIMDILVDFNLLDETKEPAIMINGLLVRLFNYEKLFPDWFEDYRTGSYKRFHRDYPSVVSNIKEYFSFSISYEEMYESLTYKLLSEVERLSGQKGHSILEFYKNHPLFNIDSKEKAKEFVDKYISEETIKKYLGINSKDASGN